MIKFGTSGWRGIIAEDFTFDNVRLVTQAICDHINANEKNPEKSVVVGYDTRFLSEEFAKTSCEVLAGNGIKALYTGRSCPTPVISFEILRRKASGGINFTASHNPAEYNGLKYSPSWGGPALPETTKDIEHRCVELKEKDIRSMSFEEAGKKGLCEEIDPRKNYFKRIKELIDFKAIKKGALKVALDDLYGTGIGYIDNLLEGNVKDLKVLHNWRDVLFGGRSPEPNEANLEELYSVMKKEYSRLGLAVDGDADRFGIVDSDGAFINPNQVLSVLVYYLAKIKGWKGIVARSVMTTHRIDKLAAKLGLEVKETPVGFKYIGELLVNEKEKFIIGGEESGGLTIRGHVPEKDGILACLLVAEMAASTKKTIKKILEEIDVLTGPVINTRLNFHLSKEAVDNFKRRLNNMLPQKFGGIAVDRVITLDGVKFLLADTSWIGFRFSGTEPVVRLYAESDSHVKLKRITTDGEKFIKDEQF